jgi:hypothetical protein
MSRIIKLICQSAGSAQHLARPRSLSDILADDARKTS